MRKSLRLQTEHPRIDSEQRLWDLSEAALADDDGQSLAKLLASV